MTSDYESSELFLSYEGVHEVCPPGWEKDHTLALSPIKPALCLELVVAKLEDSNLNPPSSINNKNNDWFFVKSQRRGRSRFAYRTTFKGKKYQPTNPPSNDHGEHNLTCNEVIFNPPSSPHFADTVVITNAFASLAEFQINSNDVVQLNPPLLSSIHTHEDLNVGKTSDDLDDDFLKALVLFIKTQMPFLMRI